MFHMRFATKPQINKYIYMIINKELRLFLMCYILYTQMSDERDS